MRTIVVVLVDLDLDGDGDGDMVATFDARIIFVSIDTTASSSWIPRS